MTQISNTEHSKSEAKTAAILKGAMETFLTGGYAATSMDKVAKAAGVSKATVYSHFGDKENLFNTLIQNLAREKFQMAISLQQTPILEQEPKLVLQQMATQMLENSMGDRTCQNFIRIVIGESGRFPELARAYVKNIAQPAIDILSEYFKSHPKLKLKDPEATVRVMVGTLVYFVILQEMLNGKDIIPLEKERVVSTLAELIAGD